MFKCHIFKRHPDTLRLIRFTRTSKCKVEMDRVGVGKGEGKEIVK